MHQLHIRLGIAVLTLVAASLAASRARAEERFLFQEKDRVVFLGDTLLEREQTEGYLETLLTARFPDKQLSFRNLSWAGDTVYGDSRAAFDTAKEGFDRMVKQVHDAEPTVIMLCFGRNESFEGEAGLANFVAGYNKLLDAVADTNARTVFWGLPLLENLGYPLPDSTPQNKNVVLHDDAVKKLAAERGGRFIDIQGGIANTWHAAPLTDNNIHFSNYGYWFFALVSASELGYSTTGGEALSFRSFTLTPEVFFTAPLPADAPKAAQEDEVFHRLLFAPNERGTYELRAGDEVIHKATSEEWEQGIEMDHVSEVTQFETLRAAVKEKNRLFFNQWRPQNETYILGFRKHEQGQYAAEIPLYDPLITAAEEKIVTLSTPTLVRYTMHRVEDGQ